MTRSPFQRLATLTSLPALAIAGAARAAVPADTRVQPLVTTGLSSPVFVATPPDDATKLFIVEQGTTDTGRIKIFDRTTGALQTNATAFLTIPGLEAGGEKGLLGMAFHPDYGSNGKFYVNVTAPQPVGSSGVDAQTQIREYTAASATSANVASLRQVLQFNQPQSNHNGGWIGFGPRDGMLYVASGDGGGSNDPNRNAPNVDSLLGKMLRVNVDRDDFPADANRNYGIPTGTPITGEPANPFATAAGADEVWSYGLRNPFRNSFDRQTGDLWIADVGQDDFEEVNVQPDRVGGQNYGWPSKEGTTDNDGVLDPIPAGVTDPVHEYGRSLGGAVTGGYVYRGNAIPGLRGTYLFADFSSGRIFALEGGAAAPTVSEITSLIDPASLIGNISSFGEDANGELFVVDYGGKVFAVVPEPAGAAVLGLLGAAAGLRRRRR